MFGGAAFVGIFALGALTACAILALALAVKGWLAALIVAAALGAIAGVLALTGAKNVKQGVPPTPERTIDSVKEDVEWTKQRAKEGRR
jgi:apolipoprotein N-acyltransferase